MLWINFLHIYQPGNMKAAVIDEATQKSYLRIIKALEENPQTRFTMNVSGCLLLRWEESGRQDIIERLKALIRRGQIELVGTASYHPIVPLISPTEAERQIKENEAVLQRFFNGGFKPKGFFLPEMAYSPETAGFIKKLGYEYLVLDEIARNGRLGQTDCSKIYLDKQSGLKIIFRSRIVSNSYVPDAIRRLLDSHEAGQTVVTATDGELYGLRYEDPQGNFEKILPSPELKTMTMSEYIGNRSGEPVSAIACSWESTEEELSSGRPYAIWYDTENELQMLLWKFARTAQEAAERYAHDEGSHWVRWHLKRGLASCMFWWSSGHDFRSVFGPVAWSPDEIEKGANDLVRAIRSISDPASRQTKLEAEKSYLEIVELTWKTHWMEIWDK